MKNIIVGNNRNLLNTSKLALEYAYAGASIISVLTEKHFFEGNIKDLELIRKCFEENFKEGNKPAILLKDFVIDEYQIYEARIKGADAVLLIAAILDDIKLNKFVNLIKMLSMHSIIEVTSIQELNRALSIPSNNIIAINNRDLNTFEIDIGKTIKLSKLVHEKNIQIQNQENLKDLNTSEKEKVLCSFSGISSQTQIKLLMKNHIDYVLIGEFLMKSANKKLDIENIFGKKIFTKEKYQKYSLPLVKICGVQKIETIEVAIKYGITFIGLIFVKSSSRYIDIHEAKLILDSIRKKYGINYKLNMKKFRYFNKKETTNNLSITQYFLNNFLQLEKIKQKRFNANILCPFFVGVFANQSYNFINQISEYLRLDFVQLHGGENDNLNQKITFPTIKTIFVKGNSTPYSVIKKIRSGIADFILLDTQIDTSKRGGTGRIFNQTIAEEISKYIPIFVAGGLNPTNVVEAIKKTSACVLDVSSGCETNGVKNSNKIKEFFEKIQ